MDKSFDVALFISLLSPTDNRRRIPIDKISEDDTMCQRAPRDWRGVQEEGTSNLLDITFENGVMEILFFSIEDATKSRFMNLVAFKQCNRRGKRDFTSYAAFMDYIIDTGKDVAVLEQSGIIENKLATNNDAALFFNQLSEYGYLNYTKHYLAILFSEMNKYYEPDWHK